ncbi:MAG: hypothetical protein Tsb0015_17470 [Simkaniaceae bacterium]
MCFESASNYIKIFNSHTPSQYFSEKQEEIETFDAVFAEAFAQKIQNICEEIPKGHVFADTDLFLIKNIYNGLIPLNGIKVQDFKLLEKLYQRICSGHTQINIKGSKQFRKEILYDIRILFSRQIGRRLITFLADGSRPIWIKEQKNHKNSSTQKTDYNEKGKAEGIIRIIRTPIKSYFSRTSNLKKNGFLTPSPRFLALAHELVHEYNDQKDRVQSASYQKKKTFDDYDNQEEKFTIRGFVKSLTWAISGEDEDWTFLDPSEEINPFNEWFFYSAFNLVPRNDHRSGGFFAPEANPRAIDRNGNTPLHISIQYDAALDSLSLLQRGADPNKLNANQESPLHLAVDSSKKNIPLIRQMLDHKTYPANPNLQDRKGRTPLWHCVKNEHLTLARILHSRGADPAIKDVHQKSPLDLTASNPYKKRKIELIRNVLQSPEKKAEKQRKKFLKQ